MSAQQQLDQIISASQSTDKAQRDAATASIEKFKLDGASVMVYLEYITTDQIKVENRRMAAIIVKNIIKKIYGQHSYSRYDETVQKRKQQQEAEQLVNDEDDPANLIDQAGGQALQQNLVGLLMGCPDEPIAAQLLEIISLMGKRFVQTEWPQLIPELATHLQQFDQVRNAKRALEAIKKICKKYRFMFRSDDLYREMNYMIEHLSPILLNCLNMAANCLQQSLSQGPEAGENVMQFISIVNSVLHIYESILSQEELPDFYEENLDAIANVCVFMLDTDFPHVQSSAQFERLYKARAKVVRLVFLYQFKFSEYFESKQDLFFQKIWEQVANQKLTATRECERLIFAIVRYFGECAALSNYQEFMKSNLEVLFQVLVLPNISLTEQDKDEYEDEPQQYIKNDLEESDAETRRRHCMKFVQQLSKRFETEIGTLIGSLITMMQQEYQKDPSTNWDKLVTTINLIITASINCYTYAHGATDVRITADLLDQYLQSLIIPQLQSQPGQLDSQPILKATCIKFVYMFRNQIRDEHVPAFVELFADYLKSEQLVNQSYAAASIEKLLIRKQLAAKHLPVLTEANMNQQLLQKLLQNICELLNDHPDLYAVRALLRVIQLSKKNIAPFAGTLGQVLQTFIMESAKDSSVSPNYTYILFETAAQTLTYLKDNAAAFAQVEDTLTPVLNTIIEQSYSENQGYAFQIYATFLANATAMRPNYELLCDSVLNNISNWDKGMKHLIPALGTLLQTLICKFPDYASSKLPQLKEIICHLLKPEVRMEPVALKICSAIFERIGQLSDNGEFLNAVLLAIFTSLHFYKNNTKQQVVPASIMRSVHSFFSTFMVCHGSQALIEAGNKIQNGILFMILTSQSQSIKHVKEPSRDRKYTIVAYSRLLAEFATEMGPDCAKNLTSGLIELASQTIANGFVSAAVVERNTEDLLIDGAVDQTHAFSRQTFIPLTAARLELADKLQQEVTDTNAYLMMCLQETTKKIGASASALILTEKHGEALQGLCQSTGVQLQ